MKNPKFPNPTLFLICQKAYFQIACSILYNLVFHLTCFFAFAALISSSDVTRDIKHLSKSNINDASGGKKSDGHVLRHFFDDWPRSHLKPDNVVTDGGNNTTSLSISISMPGNLTSDVSLKLSTGDGDRAGHSTAQPNQPERQLGWASGWGSGPMGGPLAEALRSSNSNSPTSVLHQLQRGSAAETCIVGS